MNVPCHFEVLRRFARENGLSLVLFGLALLAVFSQTLVGLHDYNNDCRDHGQSQIGLTDYVRTGHYWEALSENWEGEFMPMSAFLLLTRFFFQKGSPESKKPDEHEKVDEDPIARGKTRKRAATPWPVHRGGWVLSLYAHSLTIAFVLLFLVSFLLHAVSGAKEYSREQALVGQPGVGWAGYIATSHFWFQSLQNWQSEFLAIGAMVILSVYLRQRGSAESKPVSAPNAENE